MKPINQTNYYQEANKLMAELFSIGQKLKGTGVNIDPLVRIMQHTYTYYILPEEMKKAGITYEDISKKL